MCLKKRLLITRPNYEIPTRYLFHWSWPLIALAKKSGLVVADLKKGAARRTRVERTLKGKNTVLAIFNGHGSADSIFGQGGELVVSTVLNADLLKGKIVFARACQSAKKLGKKAVAKGAKAYLGYKEDFVFLFDRDKEKTPLEDTTAVLFLEPSNKVAEVLVAGGTTGEANRAGKAAYRENIEKLLTSEASVAETEAVRYLVWDEQAQTCVGDQKARA